jgi:Caspase domain
MHDPMPNPWHFALVVGISSYPGYGPLHGPVNDAKDFAQWVKSRSGGGIPEENVACCISPEGEMTVENAQPAKKEIDSLLWSLRRKAKAAYDSLPEDKRAQARETSRLYIYMAGHGIMPGGGTAALLDAQAEPDRHTNLELSKYASWFVRDGTFAEICIFADCCRNYELLAVPRGPDFNEPPQLGVRVFPLIGYATTAGDQALEDSARHDPEVPPDERRGYFSRALLEGLQGSAVHPGTGFVTAEYLQAYVSYWVRRQTASRPMYQRQAIDMPLDRDHPMTFGPKRAVPPRSRVVIRFPSGFDGNVELVGPDGSSMYWQASDGPWTVNVHNGIYTVQDTGADHDSPKFADDGAFCVMGAELDVQL